MTSLATELLSRSNGSSNWYRHVNPSHLFTDGIKLLIDDANAGWLVDLVFSYQCDERISANRFQLWSIRKLPEHLNHDAVVECRTDTNAPVLCQQDIFVTDFPFDELGEKFEWYVCDQTMPLKSEY
ncbi:MAG: hypothetical protein VXZ82_03050 [Planctomycetota bacterium]|nr:hypothetical protein [Planctomycetota bacterium]